MRILVEYDMNMNIQNKSADSKMIRPDVLGNVKLVPCWQIAPKANIIISGIVMCCRTLASIRCDNKTIHITAIAIKHAHQRLKLNGRMYIFEIDASDGWRNIIGVLKWK